MGKAPGDCGEYRPRIPPAKVAWKVVILCKQPGVHRHSQGLRTIQATSSEPDSLYVALTGKVFHVVKKKFAGATGTWLARYGLMCKDVAPDIVR